MTLAKHVEDATIRLKEAAFRIDEARTKALTLESAREWLEALTEFATALADVQMFNNESVHEKLHELRGRLGTVSSPGA